MKLIRMTLELRKYWIIKLITNSTDEKLVGKIESVLKTDAQSDSMLLKLSKPVKEKLDLGELIKEQNYVHPTTEELEQIIRDAAIEESVEELIEII